jgi:hypothetical protein
MNTYRRYSKEAEPRARSLFTNFRIFTSLLSPARSGIHRSAIFRSVLFLLGIVWLTGCHFPTSHTFIVTYDGDAQDTNPGDGQCQIASGQGCTLRAAIEEANALAGMQTINFNLPAGSKAIIVGPNELPTITQPLTIDATTQTGFTDKPLISLEWGGDAYHHYGLKVAAETTIRGLGITGWTMDGIFTSSRLSLDYVRLADNADWSLECLGHTDPVDVSINHSEIIGNSWIGIRGQNCNFNINRSIVADNQGDGIFMIGGVLTVSESIIRNNSNPNQGAGIELADSSGGSITKSTIENNNFAGLGGGLSFAGLPGATLKIRDSTISGNHSVNSGGGIEVLSGNAELTNVTVTGNTAAVAGGLHSAAAGTIQVTNTILSENSGGNCGGSITSGGHNLDTESTCGFAGPGDLSHMSANLGPLQDNGGFTKTHALLPGSPALEAGDDAACKPSDQRGVSRPQGLHCDIGAFEAENPATATPPTVRSTRTPNQTSTDTPTQTSTAPAKVAPTQTYTLTRTASPILFDPVNFSTDLIYSGYYRSCTPREVTLQVKISPPELVYSLGLFYRLVEKEGTNVTPWSAGFAMTPQGGGWHTLTLYSEDFPNTSKWGHDAWVEIQLIANGKDGQPIARSEVYRKVTLGRCMK